MDEVASEAYVLRPGEGRVIDLGAFRMSVKAADEQTNGGFSLNTRTQSVRSQAVSPEKKSGAMIPSA